MKTTKVFTRALFYTALLSMISLNAHAQIQKGVDIHGEAAGDCSGVCVCMPDANTVAIGAHVNDGSASNAGHVRIYTWDGSAWVQKGTDIDGEAVDERSGKSISMPDANTIAIGAPGNGNWAGQVRIYTWNGSAWVQKGMDIDGEIALDESGSSISMPDANTVAIGAYLNDGNGYNSGHVRIYTWNGNSWVQKGIDIDGEAAIDELGFSVSMPDSNTIAIGAIFNDGIGTEAGHVRIYTWNGNSWIQKGIDIDGEAAGDWSGCAVSMPDSNIVAIGARRNGGNGIQAGHVRIYNWNGSAWVQKGIDIDAEMAGGDFGHSVSMPNANTLAIGAPYNSGIAFQAGHVRIYTWNGSSWMQNGFDIDAVAPHDELGWSVSMPDANTLAVGAQLYDGNGTNAGLVRIYTICTTTGSINPTACNSFNSPSGNYTWTTSGTYMDTIPNAAGCDSVIAVNLTINTVNISVLNTSPTLTANATGATYQWLDCNNAMAIISGQINQSFTATMNGSYAVEVTQNGCIDTSSCNIVFNVGMIQNDFGNNFSIYPNPAADNFILNVGSVYSELVVLVRNDMGQEVNSKVFGYSSKLQLSIPGEPGVYFIEVKADDKRALFKVVKL